VVRLRPYSSSVSPGFARRGSTYHSSVRFTHTGRPTPEVFFGQIVTIASLGTSAGMPRIAWYGSSATTVARVRIEPPALWAYSRNSVFAPLGSSVGLKL